jgi:hypothetical protein
MGNRLNKCRSGRLFSFLEADPRHRLPILLPANHNPLSDRWLSCSKSHTEALRHYSGIARCAAGKIRAPDAGTEVLPAILESPPQQCIQRAVSSDQHGMFETSRSGTA